MKYAKIAIFSLFLILPALSQRQIIEGGNFSGTVNWKGAVHIKGDVVITETGRLVIEPGTTIYFDSGSDLMKSGSDKTRTELIIRGTLNARGGLKEKIHFTSAAEEPRFGDWYGIEFMHVKSPSIMDYCTIEYAYNGITIKNSTIQVSNSEIKSNFYAGIMIEVKSDPKIIHNIITENDYAGVVCRKGAKPILTSNLISGNRIGLISFDVSAPNLGNTAIRDVQNPGLNQVFDNMEYNLYNHSANLIQAQNNAWGSARPSEIQKTIFDKSNDSKFGPVNFRPFQERTNTNSYVLLAQGKREEVQPATVEVEGTAGDVALNNPVVLPVLNQPNLLTRREPPEKKNDEASRPAEPVEKEKNDTSDTALEPASQGDEMLLADVNTAQLPVANEKIDVDAEAQDSDQQQIDYDHIFLEVFLDSKKTYRKKPDVPYSNALRSFWQNGRVNVIVFVDKNGLVDSAKVVKSLNAVLDKAVLETVKKYEYKPGTINGQEVKFQAMEVFNFENR